MKMIMEQVAREIQGLNLDIQVLELYKRVIILASISLMNKETSN